MRKAGGLVRAFALLSVLLASTCISMARPPRLERGEVVIEKLNKGRFQVRIVRHSGDPQITCNLSGHISKGVVTSSEIKRFAIHRRYRNGSGWSSYGTPLVGYMYFFRHNGKDLVDVQLLSRWSTDNHERRPENDGINGIYPVSGVSLSRIYDVNVRPGRKESWLESK